MTPDRNAIFVCGILGRSGTNFLRDLLVLHPDCASPHEVPEDYLLHHSNLLADYADAATARWSGGEAGARLLRALGEAALDELLDRTDGERMVTKTPSVRNLGSFVRLFPGAHVVVVVRDGRAVAESYVRSFGANYEGVMHRWAEAARVILEVAGGANATMHVVRFETLFSDLDAELRLLFDAVDLDPTSYDFEAAAKLPIRGSSGAAESQEGLHWRPVERTTGFDPTARWSSWGQRRHDRFNWIAGQEMEALGYQLVESVGGLPRELSNRVFDAGWATADRLRLTATARKLVSGLRLQGRF